MLVKQNPGRNVFPSMENALPMKQPDADLEWFCAFYDRYSRPLLVWLLGRASDPQTARDLTAVTFARALLAVPRLRSNDGTAGAWLFTVAHNLLRDAARRERVSRQARDALAMPVRHADQDPLDAVDRRLDAEALRPHVQGALAGLPVDQRRAVELRVVDGLEYDELAQREGCSAGAARIRVSRGLRTLRRELRGVMI